MKKSVIVIAAICALFFTQCKKSETKPVNENVGLTRGMAEVSLSATSGGGRSEIDGLNVKWNIGDRLYVVGATSGLLGSVYATAVNGSSATFKGVINAVSVKQDYKFYYVGDNDFTLDSNGKYTYSVASQSGVLNGDNGVANNLQLLLGTISNVTAGTTELGAVTLTSMVSLGHFEFKLNGSPYTGVVTLTGGLATAELDAKAGTLGAGTAGTITVDAAPSERYLMLIPGTQTITFTADDGISNSLMNENTIVANHSYNNTTAYPVDMLFPATVATIPVCGKHVNCASSGGVVTGRNVAEQGVCWSTSENPTIEDNIYVHNYEYSTGNLTPKNATTDNTYTGFISGLTGGQTYHVRAYIKFGDQVKYGEDVSFTTPTTEPILEAGFVNFGKPDLYWAKYNLGASNNGEIGDYYQWADRACCNAKKNETEYYVYCDLKSYRFSANNSSKFTKYCHSSQTDKWYNYESGVNEPDNKLQIETVDDCANKTLGGDWRIPTTAEWKELYDNNTWVWLGAGDTDSGTGFTATIPGRLVIKGGKNSIPKDNSVYMFLPAGGRINDGVLGVSDQGYYWSSTLSTTPKASQANWVHFTNTSVAPQQKDAGRNRGLTIRPVCITTGTGSSEPYTGGEW